MYEFPYRCRHIYKKKDELLVIFELNEHQLLCHHYTVVTTCSHTTVCVELDSSCTIEYDSDRSVNYVVFITVQPVYTVYYTVHRFGIRIQS